MQTKSGKHKEAARPGHHRDWRGKMRDPRLVSVSGTSPPADMEEAVRSALFR